MKIRDAKKKILKRNPKLEDELKKDLAFQIGEAVAQARTIKGMTQKELADKLGTKQPSIAQIENGTIIPSLRFLNRIADVWDTYLTPPQFGFMTDQKQEKSFHSTRPGVSQSIQKIKPKSVRV